MDMNNMNQGGPGMPMNGGGPMPGPGMPMNGGGPMPGPGMPMNGGPMYPNGMPPMKESKGLAIGSMVCGTIALVIGCCGGYLGLILAIIAIALGIGSLVKKQGGKGMAIAGIVCGVIALPVAVLSAAVGREMVKELTKQSFNGFLV